MSLTIERPVLNSPKLGSKSPKVLNSPKLGTKLPEELNTPEFLAKITKTVTQWSRIIAWSWTDYLVFAGTANENQEQQLKALLIQTLNQQALYAAAFMAYGNPESQARADELSEDIRANAS